MLLMQKEIVCSLSDIRYVCVSCQHCKTKVILDLKEPSEFSRKHDNALLPNECPGCRKDYDGALKPGMELLQKAYDALGLAERSVSFRGIVEIPAPHN